MKYDYAIVAVIFVIACLTMPATATRIYPAHEWIYSGGTEQQPLENCFDGNVATYCQWGTAYQQGMIKFTMPANSNITEIRLYKHSYADDSFIMKSYTWDTSNPNWIFHDTNTHDVWLNYSSSSGCGASTCWNTSYKTYGINESTFYYAAGGLPIYLAEIEFYGYAPVVADFTGTPTTGTAPLTVEFTDASSGVPTLFNWSATGPDTVFFDTPNGRNTSAIFTTNGNYTITHGASDGARSDIKTRTEYIQVVNASATTTLYVTAINSMNAYPIHGAQVNLFDVENSSWSNTTTTAGTGSILSQSSHHVNAYVSALGFSDNEKLLIPVSYIYDSVLMFPKNITNVTVGNVTLFVSVFDDTDHSKPITGAGVTVVTATSSQAQYTSSGGMAQFVVPNKSTVLVDVEALGQGYNGATQSVYTGTGSGASASVTATVYLSKKSVTPTITATTLPGGGTPTPTVTILPGCEDPMSAECQASQNDYSMGWLSQNGLTLVQFFVVCFIIFMLKGMGK